VLTYVPRQSRACSARSYTAWQMRITFWGAPRLHEALRTPGLVVSQRSVDCYLRRIRCRSDIQTVLPLLRHRTWATPAHPVTRTPRW
jgi:hypothetical protein